MHSPKVLIVSEYAYRSECLRKLLLESEFLNPISCRGGYDTLVYNDHEIQADMFLIDLDDQRSFDKLVLLFRKYRAVKKVVVTSIADSWFLTAIMQLGADGYFLRNYPIGMLEAVILEVFQRGIYIPEMAFRHYCNELVLISKMTDQHNYPEKGS